MSSSNKATTKLDNRCFKADVHVIRFWQRRMVTAYICAHLIYLIYWEEGTDSDFQGSTWVSYTPALVHGYHTMSTQPGFPVLTCWQGDRQEESSNRAFKQRILDGQTELGINGPSKEGWDELERSLDYCVVTILIRLRIWRVVTVCGVCTSKWVKEWMNQSE